MLSTPWYDRLAFVKERLPARLELRVGSKKDPNNSLDPTAVLNGQAESALDLVPYFALSSGSDTPIEVHLVMLDDPTRAFDENHIEILVNRLSDLGHNVQLIVASQESSRFRKLLPKRFKPENYLVVEPTYWSRSDGPQLKVERK